MMRRFSLLFFIPILFLSAISSSAQGLSNLVQTGPPVEKDLRAGQTHSYSVTLEKEQFLQLVIQPGGLNIVARVFLPDGKLLREITDLEESEGVACIELVSEFDGAYRFEIASNAEGNSAAIHYQIKIGELRKATDDEVRAEKNESTRKGKGLALLIETAQHLDQFRRPENRVEMQLEAAQLLWPSDEKQAQKLMAQAMETVKEVIAQPADQDDSENDDSQLGMKLRTEIIRILAPHDPEAALMFLRATRQSVETPSAMYGQADPEITLEATLINQVTAADPKRAFELAQDLLDRSFSSQLIEILNRLAQKDQDLATRLARAMAKRIQSQDLIKAREAAYLAGSLLQNFRTAQQLVKQNGDGADHHNSLLSDEEFRGLFLKVVGEMLAFSTPDLTFYTPELDNARLLAVTIRQLDAEVKTYAADRAPMIEKKVDELAGVAPKLPLEWQRYQTAANNESVDVALDTIAQAPVQMRDYLYQQVVLRVATGGDVPRAQQIIAERISNPTQREQVLYNLRQQAVTAAAEKGRIDEALRLVSKFKTAQERINLITQILEHIGPQTKRSLAVQYIEQAKNLVTTSARARDTQQMAMLLQIAATLGRYDANRAFQIVDPLIDQFNEISTAAISMNGFGHEFYADGELITSNDNPVASTAVEISDTLATLAMYDFDRAKIAAEGIQRMDVRLSVFLTIAQRTLEIEIETPDTAGYGYNRD
jgi:hypothetical protein